MSVNKNKAVKAVEALIAEANKFFVFLGDPDLGDEIPEEEFGPRFSEIEKKFIDLSLLSETPGKRSKFSEFFSSVGDSVVEAQKSLDVRSNEYLGIALAQTHVLPTVFRIPKVSAEIKFALEKSEGEEVDLIFYSQSEQATTMHQQSVNFEITAVPPPPELAEKIISLTPRIDLILSLSTRAAVFNAVEASETLPSLHKEVLLKEENRDRVLISPADPEKRYLLLFAADTTVVKHIGVWHLILTPPRLEPVYYYDRAPRQGEVLKPLKDMVLDLAKKQAEFLKQTR
ncbi:hypothetical protein ACFL9T_05210 [Thermodesulfobacteriota bacterium]